jgi:hypothetical protein
MESTRGNDIPQEENGRASHFTPLQRDDFVSMPQGMYGRAMLRAYAESLGSHEKINEDTHVVAPPSELQEPDSQLVSSEIDEPEGVLPPDGFATVVPVQAVQPAVVRRRIRHTERLMLGALAALAGIAVALGFALSREVSQPAPLNHVVDRLVDIDLPVATLPAAVTPTPLPVAKPIPPPVSTPRPAPAVSTQPQPGTAPPRVREARSVAQRPSSTDGSLVVTSDPPGARVTVNGIGWGVTPVTIPYLPFGTKQVRLIKPGYESEERTLRLESDRPRQTLRVTLRSRPVAKAPGHQQE